MKGKVLTPKPHAPEPMEVTTGFYITFEEIRWNVYNLAFSVFGKTRYWKRLGHFLW